jgi:hypothetical protein
MAARLMWIVWPAFLAACVLELLVFAFVDPFDLQWAGRDLGLPRQAAYTIAFFAFWIVTMVACALTAVLRMTPSEVNACPYPRGERPAGCPGESNTLPT